MLIADAEHFNVPATGKQDNIYLLTSILREVSTINAITLSVKPERISTQTVRHHACVRVVQDKE